MKWRFRKDAASAIYIAIYLTGMLVLYSGLVSGRVCDVVIVFLVILGFVFPINLEWKTEGQEYDSPPSPVDLALVGIGFPLLTYAIAIAVARC